MSITQIQEKLQIHLADCLKLLADQLHHLTPPSPSHGESPPDQMHSRHTLKGLLPSRLAWTESESSWGPDLFACAGSSSGAPLSEAGTASFCLLPFTKPPKVACLALPLIHSQSGAGKPVILCLLALTAAGRDQKFVRAALVGEALTKLAKSLSLSGPRVV